jgi:hypothetical protein
VAATIPASTTLENVIVTLSAALIQIVGIPEVPRVLHIFSYRDRELPICLSTIVLSQRDGIYGHPPAKRSNHAGLKHFTGILLYKEIAISNLSTDWKMLNGALLTRVPCGCATFSWQQELR